jgi:hypothetical protein
MIKFHFIKNFLLFEEMKELNNSRKLISAPYISLEERIPFGAALSGGEDKYLASRR